MLISNIKLDRHNRNSGFTIIEVLIVLVIAAFILLIVFLAVPIEERHSRDNERKQDVQKIVAAVDNYVSDNQGQYPTNANQLDLSSDITDPVSGNGLTTLAPSVMTGSWFGGQTSTTHIFGSSLVRTVVYMESMGIRDLHFMQSTITMNRQTI